MKKSRLLKQEKNENQHVIFCLSENPAECKSLLNIMPLDSRVKPENDKEVGRSMVEMLGVLAVMGVLSVTGIAGYNNAMNHHRANELLNEVQKRAVVVAAQAAQGRESLSISEFTHPSGYLFDVKNWNTTQFAVTLTQDNGANIDAKICGLLKNRVGQNSPIREIRQNCTHFIFNKDLSAVSVGNTTCSNDSDCDGWDHCENGFCAPKCQSDEVQSPGQVGTSEYYYYFCKPVPPVCATCKSDQYCAITSSSIYPDSPDIASCQSLPELQKRILPKATQGKIEAYVAGRGVTYWSAKNICENHGKKLISLTSLGLKKERCDSNCQTLDGADVPEEYWLELENILSDGVIWTNNAYGSAQHYVILLGDSSVNDNNRHIRWHNNNKASCNALCID